MNFRSKLRCFKPYYASIKYKFNKKVFINRETYKKVKLLPKKLKNKNAIESFIIKPRVMFLFNTNYDLKTNVSKKHDAHYNKVRRRLALRGLNKVIGASLAGDKRLIRLNKKPSKLKLSKPLNAKLLTENTHLINNVIDSIKPKLELMSYFKRNGPNGQVRVKNKLRFINRKKPYKLLANLMRFTTDEYSTLPKRNKYSARELARGNVELFKKNLFIPTALLSREERQPYYEALAEENTRLRPVFRNNFVFKFFYFNQRSLSLLKEPNFKKSQKLLSDLMKVRGSKKPKIKKRLKKKTKKLIYSQVSLSNRTLDAIKLSTTSLSFTADKKKLKPKKRFKRTTNKFGKTKPLRKRYKLRKRLTKLFIEKPKEIIKSSTSTKSKYKQNPRFSALNNPNSRKTFKKGQGYTIPKAKPPLAYLIAKSKLRRRSRKNVNLNELFKANSFKVFNKMSNPSTILRYRYKKLRSLT